jgi:YVTN family beta-propeller protein
MARPAERPTRSLQTRIHRLILPLTVATLVVLLAGIGGLPPTAKVGTGPADPVPTRVVALATTNDSFAVVRTVLVGYFPVGVAVDSANDQIFVTNEGVNNVSVLNGTTGAVIASIPTPGDPWGITYDSDNGLIYVADYHYVTIINGTTDTDFENLSVYSNSPGIAFDPDNRDVYVSDPGPYGTTDNLSIINGTTNTFVGSGVEVGAFPLGVAVDPVTDRIYVANAGSDNLTVINGSTNQVLSVAPDTGTDPISVLYDPLTGDLYITNSGSNNLTAINGTTDQPASAGIPLASGSGPWGLALDGSNGDLFVGGNPDGNVTVVDPATGQILNASIPLGSYEGLGVRGMTFDDRTGQVWAVDTWEDTASAIEGGEQYEVQFEAAGLPSGTPFNVTLGADQNSSLTPAVGFWEESGSYNWSIAPIPGFEARWTGEVNVSGAPVTVLINFTRTTYPVQFDEEGVPADVPWYVNFTSAPMGLTPPTSGPLVVTNTTFELANGTYHWSAQAAGLLGGRSLSGSVHERAGNSSPASPILLAFVPSNYSADFEETGLPTGTPWYVNVTSGPAGFVLPSSGPATTASITLPLTNGSYTLTIQTANRTYATQVDRSLEETGGVTDPGQPIVATFEPVMFPMTFRESGLPTGTPWQANVSGGSPITSTGAVLTLLLTNGSYVYQVAATGYSANPSNGPLTVNGEPATAISINFSALIVHSAPPEYTVTFVESGLANSTSWGVALNATTRSSSGTSLSFQETNGSYFFSAPAVTGYTESPASGRIPVVGKNVTIDLTYAAMAPVPGASSPTPSTFLGLPAVEGCSLLAGAVILVAVVLAVLLIQRRRRPPPNDGMDDAGAEGPTAEAESPPENAA